MRGEGVGIGRIAGHLNRRRTEIVHSRYADSLFIHRFDDARQLAETEPMRGFNVFEAQLADFIAYGAAIFVAAAVPAGGKDIHAEYCIYIPPRNQAGC